MCDPPPPPHFAVSQRANKRPGATFFPQKVIEELRARLGGLAAAGAASDEYVARCIEIRDELDDELRAYRDSIDKYMELDAGVLARSMNVG